MTASTSSPSGSGRLHHLTRALRSRDFRLYFVGQGTSLVGTWLTRVATSWLIYRLTGSALILGVVGFAGQIPSFLLMPFAGVWVDRTDRHRLLVVTQIALLLNAAMLAALSLTHVITVTHVLLLAVMQGLINAFDMPARQAFLVDMVQDREDLGNAIALNSSLVNGSRLIGPTVAGLLIAGVGEGLCFLIDAISYVAVVASLLAMHARSRPRGNGGKNVWQELHEGFKYAFGFPPIRALLLQFGLVSLMGMPYTVLMPVFAEKVLRGGPETLGFLMTAAGVGALGGALYLAGRRSVLGLGRIIVLATGLFGASLIAFAASRWLWLSLLVLAVGGLGMMVQMAATNTILQTIVEDDKRGRVMSFYTMAFVGMMPFGSLLAGGLAATIGAPGTVAVGGAACLAGAAWFGWKLPNIRRYVRPIYVDRGILPALATGVGSASQLRLPPEE